MHDAFYMHPYAHFEVGDLRPLYHGVPYSKFGCRIRLGRRDVNGFFSIVFSKVDSSLGYLLA